MYLECNLESLHTWNRVLPELTVYQDQFQRLDLPFYYSIVAMLKALLIIKSPLLAFVIYFDPSVFIKDVFSRLYRLSALLFCIILC